MVGPSPATTVVAPRARMAWTAASITPATRPRHPTWTAPWTPSGDPRATGAQSAVSTTRHGSAPSAPDRSGRRPPRHRPRVVHRRPCAPGRGARRWWRPHHDDAGPRGSGAGGERSGRRERRRRGPGRRSAHRSHRGLVAVPRPDHGGTGVDPSRCGLGAGTEVSAGTRGRRTRRRPDPGRPRPGWRRCPRARGRARAPGWSRRRLPWRRRLGPARLLPTARNRRR